MSVSGGQATAVADSVGRWRPFPDTNAALVALKRRFKLGVLSNVDRDLFARTAEQFEVAFDFVVTAEDVRSYKPALPHFERFLDTFNGRDGGLHVAQSQYHDGVPAAQLGIPFVWINRRREQRRKDVRPVAEYPDLASFVEAVENVKE